MDEKIELEIKYTADDYVRAMHFMQNRLPFNKYGFLFFPLVIVLFVALYSFFASSESKESPLPAIVIGLVIGSLISALFLLFKNIPNPLFKWNVSRQFKSAPAFQETQRVIFDEDGIKGQNNLGGGETKWGAVIEAIESKDDFLFYTAKKFAMFFPKRCFANVEQQNQLRELIKRKLGDKAKF